MQLGGLTGIKIAMGSGMIAIFFFIVGDIYLSKLTQDRRVDGLDTMASIVLAEERYHSINSTYGTLAQVWGGVTESPGGYYRIAVAHVSATSYRITETGIGIQAADKEENTDCSVLTYAVNNGAITRAPLACWLG